MTCEYCLETGGEVLWQDGACRVVLAPEPDFPGFCRVIWQRHVREMSDLAPAERERLMNVVFTVERNLRELMSPEKMNLASLGNVTPHLHWHVIPRFADDSHYPAPVWAESLREAAPRRLPPGWKENLSAALAAQLAVKEQ